MGILIVGVMIKVGVEAIQRSDVWNDVATAAAVVEISDSGTMPYNVTSWS